MPSVININSHDSTDFIMINLDKLKQTFQTVAGKAKEKAVDAKEWIQMEKLIATIVADADITEEEGEELKKAIQEYGMDSEAVMNKLANRLKKQQESVINNELAKVVAALTEEQRIQFVAAINKNTADAPVLKISL